MASKTYEYGYDETQNWSGEKTLRVSFGPNTDDKMTFLSLFLWRAGWKGSNEEYVTFLVWDQRTAMGFWRSVGANGGEFRPPDGGPVCTNATSSTRGYDNCVYNFDVTKFVTPDFGGSIRIKTVSNNVKNTSPFCMKDGEYAVYVRAEVSHGSIPTPRPSAQPSTVEQGSQGSSNAALNINVSLDTAAQAAVIMALICGALGVFFASLRANSKAVVLSKPKVAIILGLIAGEVVTAVVLLTKLYESKFEVWGVIITLMRLMHLLIAISILATISGPSWLRKYSSFSQLLDREHMAINPKMYALASVLTLFDIKAFVLLPWYDSPFAQSSFGLPNMAFFRIVQFTSIFTAIFTLISQVPYVTNNDASEGGNAANYFFYVNMTLQGVKAFVSWLAYCILASLLRDKAVADVTKEYTDSENATSSVVNIEAVESGVELRDYIPNPLQRAGAAAANSKSAKEIRAVFDLRDTQDASSNEVQLRWQLAQEHMQEQIQAQEQKQVLEMQARMQAQMEQQQMLQEMQKQMLQILTQIQTTSPKEEQAP